MYKRGSYAAALGLSQVPFKRRRPNKGAAPLRKGKKVGISGALKPKKARSYTRTKQRRRYPAKGLNSDKGVSFFNWRHKGQRLAGDVFKQFTGFQTDTYQKAESFQTATYGRQLVCGSFNMSLMHRGELVGMRDKVAGNNAAIDPRTYRWFLRSVRGVYHITNQSLKPVKIKLFDICCKKDIANAALDTPLEAWKKGIDDDATGTGGAVTDKHLLVGQMPGQSAEFRSNYRILRERVIELAPGAFHEHFVKIDYNRMISSTTIDNMANTGYSLAGWTYHCLIVAYSTLVNDTATTTGAPTYDKCFLDVVNNVTIKYNWMEKNAPKYTVVSELQTTAPVGGFQGIVDTAMGVAQAANGAT